jgi:hypothetical protein
MNMSASATKDELKKSVLLKIRSEGQRWAVQVGSVYRSIIEILEYGRIPLITKTEEAMFENYGYDEIEEEYRFTDDDLNAFYRAHCIRQRQPWEAISVSTTKEIAEELSVQMKIAAESKDLFKYLDYYLKVLRGYPQHWDSPTVEAAVVCALGRVGEADKLWMLLDYSWEEAQENKWAIAFFEDPPDGYDETPLKQAVAAFFDTCKEIIDASHHKPDTIYRKRDLEEMTAFQKRRLRRV